MGTSITRIIDLFSEGETVLLGMDDLAPVVVWVNKLNSFQTQEARADGSARRSERMHQLGGEGSAEKLGFDAEMSPMTQEQLAEQMVSAQGDEIYLDVINDIETAPEWRERRERMERVPALLDDAGAAEDDPRRAVLLQDQTDWLAAIRDGQTKQSKIVYDESLAMERTELLAQLWERYRQRQTLDVFIAERRATTIFFALRDCNATDLSTEVGRHEWDHQGCDHTKRLLNERSEVYALPDSVIEKVQDSLDGVTVSARAAGNSAAPSSSSGSSEPASAPEAASSPSTPEAT